MVRTSAEGLIMTISAKECAANQKRLADEARKEKHYMFNKLQSYMEEAIDKINSKLEKISESLIENNTNTENLITRQNKADSEIDLLKLWRAGLVGAFALFVLLLPYLVSVYAKTTIDEEKVREIVDTHISTNYEGQWQD